MIINPKPSRENLGGKAYHLNLLKKKFDVPDFFVILINDIRELEEENKKSQYEIFKK